MKSVSYKTLERDLFVHDGIFLTNSEVYSLIEELTSLSKPNLVFSSEDKRWLYFYFPSRDEGKTFLIPFGVTNYRDYYFLSFSGLNKDCNYFSTNIRIERGSQNQKLNDLVKNIIELAIKNYKVLYKNPEKIEEMVPIRFREGKIKSKYVYKPLLTKREAEKIRNLYLEHLRSCQCKEKVSLKEYLEVASIAISTIYNVSGDPIELYKKYSDFRRGDILDIDASDPKAFEEWHKKNKNSGLHPYEIIAGYYANGITLYPPFDSKNGRYILTSSPSFYPQLLKIALKFIENKIPFEFDYKNILKHLTGENYLEVNTSSSFSIIICNEEDPLAKKVKWKKLTLPEPK